MQAIIAAKRKYLQGRTKQLILNDEFMYPPAQRGIQEIYISQFASSLTDQALLAVGSQFLERKNKLPLPLVFAFGERHMNHDRPLLAIKMFIDHVDRKSLENSHVLLYNVAKLYEKVSDFRRATFYL